MIPSDARSCTLAPIARGVVWVCLILMFGIPAPAYAEQVRLTDPEREFIKTHPRIVLGSDPDWQPYVIQRPDGSVTGFDADILNLVNEYTGARFKLVAGKWGDMLEKAAQKQIDGLSTSAVVESRKSLFNFSVPYFSFPKTLIVANNNPGNIQSVNDLKGRRVGYQAGNAFNRAVLARYEGVTLVPVTSLKQIVRHLISGKIDAAIESNSIYFLADAGAAYLKTVDVFPDSTLHLVFSIRKDYPRAVSILNKGLAAIPPDRKMKLVNKWFVGMGTTSKTNGPIDLTAEEKAWLALHPVISVGTTRGLEPVYVRQMNGGLSGVIPDIFHILGQRLGVRFRYETDDWHTVLVRAQKGELDIIGALSKQAAQGFGLKTVPHAFEFYTVAFTRKSRHLDIRGDEDINGLAVAYNTHIKYVDRFVRDNKHHFRPVPCDSALEGFKALLADKADVFIGFNFDSYVLKKNTILDIAPAHIFASRALKVDHSIGVKSDDPVLFSIIRKAVATLTPEDVDPVISRWTWETDPARDIRLTGPERQYLAAKKEITVGCLATFVPFSFMKDNLPDGYSVAYMRHMGRKIGKPVRFVTRPWSELLNLLKHGDLDVIPHIAVTPEREKFADYTDFVHIAFLTGFAVRNIHTIDSISDLAGKKIAVVNRYFLHDYLSTLHPEIPLVLTSSTEESVRLVLQGRAHAAIGNIPNLNYLIQEKWLTNLKIETIDDLGVPLESQLRMAVTKGNAPLKSILEKANAAVSPEKVLRLKQKWLFRSGPKEDERHGTLTPKEKLWVKQHPEIRFRIRPGRPPFEFSENGRAAGLAVDYITAAAEFAGIKPVFIVSDMPLDAAFQMVEGDRKLFDTLAFAVKNEDRSRRFSFGTEFMAYPMMIIGHNDSPFIGKTGDLKGRNVAVEKGFLTRQWLERDFPGIRIVTAATTMDALRMVNDKKADAYIGNLAVANYMMSHGGMKNLKIFAPSGYGTIKYSFVAPGEWPELAAVLSKGYRSLPPEFHTALQQQWFTMRVVEKVDYGLIWRILAGAALVVGWVLWWNRKLLRAKQATEKALSDLRKTKGLLEAQNVELERLSVTDKLTGLYNRQKLDEVLQSEHERTRRYKDPFGVIMADIDHFKRVNDTHGHQVGDTVLKAFARLLKTHVRKADTPGRWGGEEFMIICPRIDKDGLLRMAENLRRLVASHAFEGPDHLTASFGAALGTPDDTIEQLILRADTALYDSKKEGRNRATFRAITK